MVLAVLVVVVVVVVPVLPLLSLRSLLLHGFLLLPLLLGPKPAGLWEPCGWLQLCAAAWLHYIPHSHRPLEHAADPLLSPQNAADFLHADCLAAWWHQQQKACWSLKGQGLLLLPVMVQLEHLAAGSEQGAPHERAFQMRYALTSLLLLVLLLPVVVVVLLVVVLVLVVVLMLVVLLVVLLLLLLVVVLLLQNGAAGPISKHSAQLLPC